MSLIAIAEFPDTIAADVARIELESVGILSFLFDGGMASLGLGMMTPVRLMVEEDDAARARAALEGLPKI